MFKLYFLNKEEKEQLLISSCQKNNYKMVSLLLKYNININIREHKTQNTPLHISIINNNRACVLQLLRHNADVNLQNNKGYSALMLAAKCGLTNILCDLLHNNETNINLQNNVGDTALTIAVNNNYIACIKKLLEYNADVNTQDIHGNNALILAVNIHSAIITELLLNNKKTNINLCNKYGESAFMVASCIGDVQLLSLLYNYNADIHLKDKYGNNALHLAVCYNKVNTATKLLEWYDYKIDILQPNYKGKTVLDCTRSKDMFNLLDEYINEYNICYTKHIKTVVENNDTIETDTNTSTTEHIKPPHKDKETPTNKIISYFMKLF